MKIRTGYSFKHAVGHLPEVISRIKEIGWKVAPISDRMSTFGYNRFTKLAKAAGLRTIYGVELAVVPEFGEAKPTPDFWTFFAKDTLRPLHDLIGLATNHNDRNPSITYKQALSAKGVIKISGERIKLDAFKGNKFSDFYIGLSPALPKALFNQAKKRGFKFLAIGDNTYTRAEDLEFYRVTLGRRAETQTYHQHILSDSEWKEACSWIADAKTLNAALKARDEAMKKSNAALKKAVLLQPKKEKTLLQLCIEGAKRTGTNLNDPIYKARLDRELSLIAEKDYEDYFYVIADMVNYAKKIMIVGPARGSSCGSLVCYLLNITSVDPIPFGLIFERFIDTTRTDLPDIDIDFSDERRNEVFRYAEKKYGAERVARLGTVMLFKPRSALNQAGFALKIPYGDVQRVLDGVIERSGGDSRALQALEDTLSDTEAGRKMLAEYPEVKIAGRMEGHPNNASQHAAGIVITQQPVAEYVAVDHRTKSAMVDKKDAEELNLLKIDALGLTQLSIFERASQLIGKPDKNGWLEKLPLDDKKAFEVLNRGHFAGVFQFTGAALQSLTKQITITHIEDMISITALARPGPMATGGANSWAKRKTGREEITEIHPMLTELTKGTYGVVTYQEQVINVARYIGKLTWEDTTELRKAMSKSMGDEFFEGYWSKFLVGAKENGIDEVTARAIWEQVNTMGSWSFNRSHAVAYGLVSYWCCWLKAHHPLEFAAATLDAEVDPARQVTLLREMKTEGISYIPVDPKHSIDKWVPIRKGRKKILVGPLTMIKGIGPATVIEIMDARKDGSPLRDTLIKKLSTAQTEIDSLYPIGDTIKKLHPDLTKINIFSEPTPIRELHTGWKGDVLIFAVAVKIVPRDENEQVKCLRRLQLGRPIPDMDPITGKLSGPTAFLNLFMKDDTDEIFATIDRHKFEEIGRPISERGRSGKAIYAVKGYIPARASFRMISVQYIRYLGDMEMDLNAAMAGGRNNLKAGEQTNDAAS